MDPARSRDERGATLVEYALVLALLIGGIWGAIELLGRQGKAEVVNQAECVSMRPPPATCQPRSVGASEVHP